MMKKWFKGIFRFRPTQADMMQAQLYAMQQQFDMLALYVGKSNGYIGVDSIIRQSQIVAQGNTEASLNAPDGSKQQWESQFISEELVALSKRLSELKDMWATKA